jgi:hypothetical protein
LRLIQKNLRDADHPTVPGLVIVAGMGAAVPSSLVAASECGILKELSADAGGDKKIVRLSRHVHGAH